MENTKLDVRVYPIDEPKGNTKAFASVSINDMVAIRGVRVVEDKKGLFVTMPQSFDKKTEKYHDIAFPLSGDLRKEINKTVLDEHSRVSVLPPEQRGYENPEPTTSDVTNMENIKLDIRVYPLENQQGNTKAFATMSIDDLVAIRGIRVVEGADGLFVAMSQSQDRYLKYHDVAFPLTADLRKEISAGVLEKYNGEKSAERKPTLGSKLTEGKQKAAEHSTTQKPAAKSRAGVLE